MTLTLELTDLRETNEQALTQLNCATEARFDAELAEIENFPLSHYRFAVFAVPFVLYGLLRYLYLLYQTARGDTPATAILRGGDLRMLGVTSMIFPYSLIAAKNVKSPKDLVGGRIGINRVGDVSAYGSQLALRKLGLNPEKDVTMMQVGGSPQRLAALQSGAVQAAAMDFMSGLRLAKLGFPVLVQLNLNYPYLGPMVSGKFLRENPATAEAFLKAFIEGIARFKRNREEGIKALARYMKSNETDVLHKAYDFIANDFYAENIEPDAKSFQDLMDEIGEREPLAKKATIAQVFDLTIARKLDKEGFFKTAFKR